MRYGIVLLGLVTTYRLWADRRILAVLALAMSLYHLASALRFAVYDVPRDRAPCGSAGYPERAVAAILLILFFLSFVL